MALTQPLQQTMDAAPLGPVFGDKGAVFVIQTPRGCLWELCTGGIARNEYKMAEVPADWEYKMFRRRAIAEIENGEAFEAYVIEESSCFARNILREMRPAVMKVSTGSGPGGHPLIELHKPLTLGQCSCCCQPNFTAKLPDGTALNRSRMARTWCSAVPYFVFEEPPGTAKYLIHPPTCCFGMNIKPECGGGKPCCSAPFYFYDAKTGEQIEPEGSYPPQMKKIINGSRKACCTAQNNFAIKFPEDMTAEQKAGLLGMAILLDMTIFEKRTEGKGD